MFALRGEKTRVNIQLLLKENKYKEKRINKDKDKNY